MRFPHRAVISIIITITVAPMVAAAAASASSIQATARAVKDCIRVTDTISVGGFPEEVAANPKTKTIYVANDAGNTVSVISGLTNTVTATIPVGTAPTGIAGDQRADQHGHRHNPGGR